MGIRLVKSNTKSENHTSVFHQWLEFDVSRQCETKTLCCVVKINIRKNEWNWVLFIFYVCVLPSLTLKLSQLRTTNELQREKTYLLTCRPSKIQISLRTRTVWSVFVFRKLWRNFASKPIQNAPRDDSGQTARINAPREDSGQTARMHRLIWIFAGRTFRMCVFRHCGSNTRVLWKTQLLLFLRIVRFVAGLRGYADWSASSRIVFGHFNSWPFWS